MKRAVITGVGLVTPLGGDLATLWAALCDGRSAIAPISRFDPAGFPTRIAAQARGFDLDLDALVDRWPHWRRRGRIAQFAAAAADAAIADAGGAFDGDPARHGVVVASGTSVYEHEEVFGGCAGTRVTRTGPMDWGSLLRGLRASLGADALLRRTPGSLPAQLAADRGLRGPAMSVMTACAGGTQALGDALRWIRMGRADVVLAGGADSEITPLGLASFCLLGALSRRNDTPGSASRPFDATRDGFVMGEGAGMLVLEERERALARGARIYAEVAGFGSACDAYRVTDPHPEGSGALTAMRQALATARAVPADVGYVNAHGTGTPANDPSETRALKRLLGDRAPRVPISSTKSMLGHAMVAAGAIEAIVTALSVQAGRVHPTINLSTPDPACDLDYVPEGSRTAAIDMALSNSFAFGGQTACLAIRRHVA